MKKSTIAAALLLQATLICAQDIQLPKPDLKQKSKSVVEALYTRQSAREYANKDLTLNQISNICWAAIGKNKYADHITAPSALNRQEVRVFVFTKDGVYEYLNAENRLAQKAKGDYRKLVAGTPERSQDFVLNAPISLVLVSDLDKFGKNDDQAKAMTAVDVGIVNQNVNLYCEGVGLANVPRATMDSKEIQKLLSLNENQIPLMNNVIGIRK